MAEVAGPRKEAKAHKARAMIALAGSGLKSIVDGCSFPKAKAKVRKTKVKAKVSRQVEEAKLVEGMVALNQQLSSASTEHARSMQMAMGSTLLHGPKPMREEHMMTRLSLANFVP